MAKVKILKDGFTDITSTDISNFAIHSDYKCQKIGLVLSQSFTYPATTASYSIDVTHNFGYPPPFYTFIEYEGNGYEVAGNANPLIEVPASGGGNTDIGFNIYVDNTKLYVDAFTSPLLGVNDAAEDFILRAWFVIDEIV